MKTRHLKNFHFINEFRVGTVTRLAIAISHASSFLSLGIPYKVGIH